MKYFTELLESYEQIKQRKFKLTIDEAVVSPELQQAESIARGYVNQAVAKSKTDNYIVVIPEIGTHAQIFVAKKGKQAGMVVVDNVLGPYPIAIADGTGTVKGSLDSNKGGLWRDFVKKFAKEPQQDIFNDPQQQLGQDQGIGGIGQSLMPMSNPEINQVLTNTTSTLIKLISEDKFFAKNNDRMEPIWMQSGAMGDYAELVRRIVGPDPFSLESKINNGKGLFIDPNTDDKMFTP